MEYIRDGSMNRTLLSTKSLKNLQFVVLCVLQGLNLTTLAILKRSTPKLDTYFIHLVVQMFLGNLIITSESRKRNVNTT